MSVVSSRAAETMYSWSRGELIYIGKRVRVEKANGGFTPNLFPKKGTERFEQDFRFQLTKEEFKNLMCKNFTSRWTQTRNNTEEIRQIKQQVNDLTVVINDFTDKNIKKDYLFYNG